MKNYRKGLKSGRKRDSEELHKGYEDLKKERVKNFREGMKSKERESEELQKGSEELKKERVKRYRKGLKS